MIIGVVASAHGIEVSWYLDYVVRYQLSVKSGEEEMGRMLLIVVSYVLIQ